MLNPSIWWASDLNKPLHTQCVPFFDSTFATLSKFSFFSKHFRFESVAFYFDSRQKLMARSESYKHNFGVFVMPLFVPKRRINAFFCANMKDYFVVDLLENIFLKILNQIVFTFFL